MIDVYFDAALRLFEFAVKLTGKAFHATVRLAKEFVLSVLNVLGSGARAGYESLKDSPSTRQDHTPARASRPSQDRGERSTQQTGSRQDQREHTRETREKEARKVGQWYSLLYLSGMNPDGTGIAHVVKTYRDAKTAAVARAAEPHLLILKSSGAEPRYGTPVAVKISAKQQGIQRAQEGRTAEAQANSQRGVQKLQKSQRIGRTQSPPRHSINP